MTKPFTLTLQIILLLIGLGANIHAALGDAELPNVDPKYVSIKVKNPERDVGYVVGDTLDRTIIFTVKKPYEAVKESFPIVGYEHRWKGQVSGIELAKISAEESTGIDGQTHTLHLTYQVFTTGRVAKPAALRAEIIKLRNTQNKEIVQLRLPSFSFRVSPLSVFGQVKLREEMSPFHPPLLLDASNERRNIKILIGLLAASLIGLLYIFGVRAWLPRMGAPFAKAYRDIRKLPDNAEGLQQAVARVHQSLNKTAGNSVFLHTVEDFVSEKPRFKPMKSEIETFFQMSRQVFFEANGKPEQGENAKAWLVKFCRRCRDCERGLTPELNA